MNKTMYVFDVDGVLCDIGSPELDIRVVRELADLLAAGPFIAVNTGRGFDRISGELITPLLGVVSRKDDLNRLFVSTEMGGELHTFSNGEVTSFHSQYSLTKEQLTKAKEIFVQQGDKVSTMHWYDAKTTMGTVVKVQSAKHEQFVEQRAALYALYKDAFADDDTVVVATTVESIDVYGHKSGKYSGAQAAYEWQSKLARDTHKEYLCFGDSSNDYEMARFFAHQGVKVRFIYTGTAALAIDTPEQNIEVTFTKAKMAAGTLEYLAAHKNKAND